MNNKLKMYKLEELKRDLLEKARTIQKEISQIDTAMKEQKRLYMLNNKYSNESNEILSGRSRESIRKVLVFLLGAMTQYDKTYSYMKAYEGIDLEELLKNENFFDFVIVAMGKAVITELSKRFGEVEIVEGEEVIRSLRGKGRGSDYNFRERLFKKFTKKAVITEAKRILEEG